MLPAHCRAHDTPRAMKPRTTARLRFRKLSSLPCFPSPAWRGWRAAPDPALHSCILSVGNCSCVVLGKVPLFRPAAAARATLPSGESSQSHPRGGLRRAAHGALCCSLAASRRELAHPWARTCAPFPRAQLRCSAQTNATNVEGNGNSAYAASRRSPCSYFNSGQQRCACTESARMFKPGNRRNRYRARFCVGQNKPFCCALP